MPTDCSCNKPTCSTCSNSLQCKFFDLWGMQIGCGITRTLCDDSEIKLLTGQCTSGCDKLMINWCEALNNGKFRSNDKTISIEAVTLSTDPQGNPLSCGLNIESALEFYADGNRIFCPYDANNPNRLNLETEGKGVSIKYENSSCAGFKKMVFDVYDAAFARDLRVGCITDTFNNLQTVQNKGGSVRFLVDCSFFTIEATESVPGSGNNDIITLGILKKPVLSIGGQEPNQSTGAFNVDHGIKVVAGTTPTIEADLDNSTIVLDSNDKISWACKDFYKDGGGVNILPIASTSCSALNTMALLNTYHMIPVYQGINGYNLGYKVTMVDPLTSGDLGAGVQTNLPTGNLTMEFHYKEFSMQTITIPYDAPAGFQWMLYLGAKANGVGRELPPGSAGTISSTASPGAIYQAKLRVAGSIFPTYTNSDSESTVNIISGILARADNSIAPAWWSVPQTKNATVTVAIDVIYGGLQATILDNCNMWVDELSYNGFLALVKQ